MPPEAGSAVGPLIALLYLESLTLHWRLEYVTIGRVNQWRLTLRTASFELATSGWVVDHSRPQP